MIKTQKFIGIGQRPGAAITGLVATAMVIGKAVALKDNGLATNDTTKELELATDRPGYFLTRAVEAVDADSALKQATLGVKGEANFKSPVPVDGYATAVAYDQVIVEGDDYLDPSTITNATAQGAPLKFENGVFVAADVLAAAADEALNICGWLEQHYTPEDNTGGRTRARIRMA